MPESPAWSPALLTDPHAVADKRRRVRDMFAAIAGSYDRNNRLHSFGRDQAWRRAAVRMADLKPGDAVVDVACGTGDLTLAFADAQRKLGSTAGVLGVDFTFEMLPLAAGKSTAARVGYVNGDAQQLPLPDACCDVVSIAFGIRNVQNVDAALAEFRRVLRPGGRLIVLEFSEPTNPVLRTLNDFYLRPSHAPHGDLDQPRPQRRVQVPAQERGHLPDAATDDRPPGRRRLRRLEAEADDVRRVRLLSRHEAVTIRPNSRDFRRHGDGPAVT